MTMPQSASELEWSVLWAEYINFRVPQGSCLGHVLFLIYINDLLPSLQSSQVTMYGDDTILSHSFRSIVDLSENLNRDLGYLKQWLQGNKLSLILNSSMMVGSWPNLKKISDKKIQPLAFASDD